MTVNVIGIRNYNILDALAERISCSVKMRRTLANVKKFICRLRENIKRRNSSNNANQEYPCVLNLTDIQDSEIVNTIPTKGDISRMKLASLLE